MKVAVDNPTDDKVAVLAAPPAEDLESARLVAAAVAALFVKEGVAAAAEASLSRQAAVVALFVESAVAAAVGASLSRQVAVVARLEVAATAA